MTGQRRLFTVYFYLIVLHIIYLPLPFDIIVKNVVVQGLFKF
jgi:hypothetical protein